MINVPVNPEVSFTVKSDSKVAKDFIALLSGYKRISPIKRTRKRQIKRAAFMDHTGYEWSQWWPKRHGPRQLQVITTLSTRLLGNQRGENDELTAEISGV